MLVRGHPRGHLAARIPAALLGLTLSGVVAGCAHWAAPKPDKTAMALPADALAPSPRLIVGRIIAVDSAKGFAFVDLVTDAPAVIATSEMELITRTLELRETGRLRSSHYLRGRTLGTKIVAGQPSPGDEVVWLAP
jgi:hypothetical protein